jgi:hypothetical protein
MWCCIAGYGAPDVAKGCVTFIIKGSRLMKNNHETLKVKEIQSFETAGPAHPVTLPHVPYYWNPLSQ